MFPELSTRQDEYQRRFPKFSRPQIVGYLSLDGTRQLLHDASRLKFVVKPEGCCVSFDLNHNIDHVARKENLDEKITHLLQFLLGQERRVRLLLSTGPSLQHSRFYCYRGLLTCVANTPYEGRDGWRIVATLHRGDIYLCALDTDEARTRKQNVTDKELQFTSWGYKFEQYMLRDSPTSEPDLISPVNESEEFSLVFHTELNGHRLLYAAEMDGVQCEPGVGAAPSSAEGQDALIQYLSSRKFVELKTNRHIESPKQETTFRRFKARKWWCQSFLAGVETIVCGLRDDNGLVDQLKVYRVADLPKMCTRFWNPDVCFNFLDTFLTYVKRCLAREVARAHGEARLGDIAAVTDTTLHFEWSPRQRVRVTNNYDPQVDAILPEWFLSSYGKNCEELH